MTKVRAKGDKGSAGGCRPPWHAGAQGKIRTVLAMLQDLLRGRESVLAVRYASGGECIRPECSSFLLCGCLWRVGGPRRP